MRERPVLGSHRVVAREANLSRSEGFCTQQQLSGLAQHGGHINQANASTIEEKTASKGK